MFLRAIASFLLCTQLFAGAAFAGIADSVGEKERWDAEATRLVVISLAAFEGEKEGETSFSTSDRLDDPLVELFRERGVPEENILYLKDGEATTERVKSEFRSFLRRSQEGETLIFYYSSHGGYDPDKGEHTFTTFDGSIPLGWTVGTIEGAFKGSKALLFSDCCYSGGLVELIASRPPSPIAFGALSTTGSHNVGYSGWRFTDVLIRAWRGDAAFDKDQSNTIDFDELCRFAERYMAFVAEGKPLYAITSSFDSKLVLSSAERPWKKYLGGLIEVKESEKWYKAEVIDVERNEEDRISRIQVHFTDKNRYQKKSWVTPDEIRDYEYPTYHVGAEVEIRDRSGKWSPGKVLAVFDSMHECRFEGKSSAYDEWMSPGRIRKPGKE